MKYNVTKGQLWLQEIYHIIYSSNMKDHTDFWECEFVVFHNKLYDLLFFISKNCKFNSTLQYVLLV